MQTNVNYKCDYCIKLAHVLEILDSFNRLFLNVHESKRSDLGLNGSFIRNVHLSSGPFMWSALYKLFSVLVIGKAFVVVLTR